MDEGLDVPGVEQTGSGHVSIKDRRNLTKAHMRSLQLIGACELGRLARAQFVKLRADIPDITLKILVHGTGRSTTWDSDPMPATAGRTPDRRNLSPATASAAAPAPVRTRRIVQGKIRVWFP